MLQFVFLAVLISMPVSNLSMELSRFHFKNLQDARLGSFEEVCKWFCEDDHDYFLRTFDHVNPRIFCGLCQKKLSTTTTVSPSTITSTIVPSTTTTTVASSTTRATSPFTTSTSPTTTEPSTAAP